MDHSAPSHGASASAASADPVPCAPLAKHQFDFKGQAGITARTTELTAYHEEYIKEHPELQQVLHEYMQSLLVHKPSDSLAYTKNYFEAHREKREPYIPP
jgi:hypothetical protein